MERFQWLTPAEALAAMDDSAQRADELADVLVYLPEKEFHMSN